MKILITALLILLLSSVQAADRAVVVVPMFSGSEAKVALPVVKASDGTVIGRFLAIIEDAWLIVTEKGYFAGVSTADGTLAAPGYRTKFSQMPVYWTGADCTGQGYRDANTLYPKAMVIQSNTTASTDPAQQKTFYTSVSAVAENSIAYNSTSYRISSICSSPDTGTIDNAYKVFENVPATTGISLLSKSEAYSIPLDIVYE